MPADRNTMGEFENFIDYLRELINEHAELIRAKRELTYEVADLRAFEEELATAKSIWRCKKCGHLAPYHFYQHATRRGKMDFCEGKVVELKARR